jgi:hypothetical protein
MRFFAGMRETLRLDPTGDRWRRLEEIFHAALDLGGDDREDFLEREAPGDADLQLEVREMLRHAENAEEQIAGTVARIAQKAVGAGDWVGRRFGPYPGV